MVGLYDTQYIAQCKSIIQQARQRLDYDSNSCSVLVGCDLCFDLESIEDLVKVDILIYI